MPVPCANVARRSRDGARVYASQKAPPDEQRSKERAPACVPDDTTRSRERVGATTYRCRSGIATVGPMSPRKRPWNVSKEAPRERYTGESAKTPRIAETRTFHDVRIRNDLGRAQSSSLAQNRDARLRERRQGRQRWRAERDGAREEHSRSPASSSHRSAHGVVKRRPHRSPRNCRGVAKRHGGRTRDSVATRYDGCPLLNPWMSRSRPHASSIIGTSLPGGTSQGASHEGPERGARKGPALDW
jgi:hypothetical protein